MSQFTTDDHQYMAHALRLAEKGLYTTGPNPRVGCVLVKDGEIIAEGWHESAGGPHAEIHALQQAGDMAKGATVYVTLEPCNHHGRTAPCADALIEAGVSRVVMSMEDPNKVVAGRGHEKLENAGIIVETGLLAEQAEQLNIGFVKRMREGRPFVRCKLAMSLDGRTAMASGESKWITSPDARIDVHKLRARSSAIITGISTVFSDDPSLTVRLPGDEKTLPPLRVVLDSHLSTPPTAKMLSLPGETLIVTATDEAGPRELLQNAGAQVISMSDGLDNIDLNGLLMELGRLEINEVMLETGATLSGAMLSKGLIDELVVYMAPKLMGNEARGLFKLPGLDSMDQAIDMEITDVRPVGKDWRITSRVRPGGAPKGVQASEPIGQSQEK